jgi:hypothetical protein
VAESDSVGAPGKVAMGLRRTSNQRCSDCARGRGPTDLRGGENDWTRGHMKKDKRNGYGDGSSGEGTRWLTDGDGARRRHNEGEKEWGMEERRSRGVMEEQNECDASTLHLSVMVGGSHENGMSLNHTLEMSFYTKQ